MSVSCKPKNPANNPNIADPFELSVSYSKYPYLVVDVEQKADADINLYAVGIISKENHSDEKSDVAAILAQIEEMGGDLTSADSKYTYNEAEESVDLAENWEIEAGEEYYIYAIELDSKNNNYSSVEASYLLASDQIILEINEVTNCEITFEVTPGSGVGNYIVGLVDSEKLDEMADGDINYAADYVIEMLSELEDFSFGTADNKTVFNGAQTIDMSSVWFVAPDSEQIVLVFGVDANGMVTSKIAYQTVTTPPIEIAGKVDVLINEVSIDNVMIDLVPSKEIDVYFVGTIPLAQGEELTAEERQTRIMDDIDVNRTFNSDFYEVNNRQFYNSEQVNFDIAAVYRFAAGYDYEVYAVGINYAGFITSEISCSLVEMPSIEKEGSVSLKLDDVTSNNIFISATPSDKIENYFVGIYYQQFYESEYRGNPELLAEGLLRSDIAWGSDVSQPNGTTVFNGAITGHNMRLATPVIFQNTDYVIAGFGVDENGMVCSDVTILDVKTNVAGLPSDNQISFEINNITETEAELNIITTNYDSYFSAVVDAADYEGMSDEEIIKDLKVKVGEQIVLNLGWGNFTLPLSNLLPDTEYMVVSFGYDVEVTTGLFKQTFKTL